MHFKYKQKNVLIACVFSVLTTYNTECYKIKTETSPLITHNTTSTKEQRLNDAENNNLLDSPENNMKKLPNNTPPFYLNVDFTKEKCHTILCFRNSKLYRRTINNVEKLNKIQRRFYIRKINNVFKESASEISENLSFRLRLNKTLNKRSIADNETENEVINSTNKEEVKDEKIQFGNISTTTATRSSILEFPEAPPRHIIKALDFNQEHEYFGVFSDLMGYLQPTSFPLDFLKDVVQNHMSVHLLIFKAIKIEGRVLAWLFVWLILSMALPCAVIAQSCGTNKGMERLHDNYSISSDRYGSIKHKTIAIVMHILLILLLANIALMLAANEQISRTTSAAPKTITGMLEDIDTFVDDTQIQISTITTSSVQTAVEAIRADLEGAEELLGKPLQQALDAETGLEAAIQALTDLTSVSAELSLRVSTLMKDCNEAREAGRRLQGSLVKLSKVLSATRQGCLARDKPLCDTLQTEAFNVVVHVDQILSDRKLKRIMEIGGTENFNKTIQNARRTFEGLPRRVSLETAASRTEIRSILNKHRNEMYNSIEAFEEVTDSLKHKLKQYNDTIYEVMRNVSEKDLWRWISILGLSTSAFLVWGFLICGAPCGCETTPKTTLYLRTGLGLTCVLSLMMWICGALSFLVGSHSHVLVCQPLYEDPSYVTLNDLLNSKGVVSRQEREFFSHLFKENNTIRIDDILNDCKTNQTAFHTFALNNLIDIEALTDSYQWRDLQKSLTNFPAILTNFEILNPELLQNLQEVATLSTVNLTSHRINISQPITNRDLKALSYQLRSISTQITNTRTAEKMEELAIKAENLSNAEYKQLKHIRDEIVYEMAALEVYLVPLNKQVVQSLSHLRTIQYFINNEGLEIARKVDSDYIYKINRKLREMYHYVKKNVHSEIGNCRLLWDIYDSARSTLCRKIVDPINGFSFACFSCILLFLGLAPVVMQILDDYKGSEGSLDSYTHRRARNGVLINDECTWATPSIRSSSEEYGRAEIPPPESNWILRQPMKPLIPSPPRLLDSTRLLRSQFSEPEPTMELRTRTPETQSFAKVARILDNAKNLHARIRSPELDPAPTSFAAGMSDVARTSKVARMFHVPKIERVPIRSPELPPSDSRLSTGLSDIQHLSKVARMLHPHKMDTSSRKTEPIRNVRSPIPKIIQTMTSKARSKYESLKLIERLDQISPRSWL